MATRGRGREMRLELFAIPGGIPGALRDVTASVAARVSDGAGRAAFVGAGGPRQDGRPGCRLFHSGRLLPRFPQAPRGIPGKFPEASAALRWMESGGWRFFARWTTGRRRRWRTPKRRPVLILDKRPLQTEGGHPERISYPLFTLLLRISRRIRSTSFFRFLSRSTPHATQPGLPSMVLPFRGTPFSRPHPASPCEIPWTPSAFPLFGMAGHPEKGFSPKERCTFFRNHL